MTHAPHVTRRPTSDPAPILARYLLLTFIPYYVDATGGVWLERLWHRDFVEHLGYLVRLTLAAPRLDIADAPPDVDRVEVPPGASLELLPLPPMRSMREAIAMLPTLTQRLWRAIGAADVVQSGVAGWPVPPGWIANPIALARGRTLLLVIESAPWRLSHTGDETTVRARVREVLTEALARFFVRRADIAIFTQPEYQRTLARPDRRGCHIAPASWINAEDIVPRGEAVRRWGEKLAGPVRLLFAARLVAAKGVPILLDAIAELEARGARVAIDVIGEGPERAACVRAARAASRVRLSVLDPVPYGPAFFELVRGYHAVLVPSLGDEQPRILFDAYAQAVPVIASSTDGIRPYVKSGQTGWLVAPGRADELAHAIERAIGAPRELERMGMRALAEAPRFTHRAMHLERWRILADALGPRRAMLG